MPSGDLRERVAFDRRVVEDVEGGSVRSDWAEQLTVPARIRPLRGGEGVIAARLQGTQPVVITVRYSSATKTIDPSWRCRDARTGREYNIRTATPDERRVWVDLLCEAGPAT